MSLTRDAGGTAFPHGACERGKQLKFKARHTTILMVACNILLMMIWLKRDFLVFKTSEP
jgi:hypothetical protein